MPVYLGLSHSNVQKASRMSGLQRPDRRSPRDRPKYHKSNELLRKYSSCRSVVRPLLNCQQEAPGRGRKPRLPAEEISLVVERATRPPQGRTRWSRQLDPMTERAAVKAEEKLR